MINWNCWPHKLPPVGEPIVVWYKGAVCPAKFDRSDGKWCWWITYYNPRTKYGWTTELVYAAAEAYWSVQNAPTR